MEKRRGKVNAESKCCCAQYEQKGKKRVRNLLKRMDLITGS